MTWDSAFGHDTIGHGPVMPAEHGIQRLLAQERALGLQHAAVSEIRLAMIAGASLGESLSLICEHAAALVRAPTAVICAKEGDELRIMAAVGPATSMVGSALEAGGSFAQQVIEANSAIEIKRRTDVSTIAQVPATLPDGPTFGVPVVVGGGSMGALTFIREFGEPGYDPTVRVFAEALAAQAALAFELERARADNAAMTLAKERERIAHDLHDSVISQLFTVGLELQSLLGAEREDPAAVAAKLKHAISAIDTVIGDVRASIFALGRHCGGSG